jgi:formylglycine-generating enzyme required for sulfatase activity
MAFALVLPALVASAPPDEVASSEHRVALVIGNASYTRPGEKLVNPCRDAKAVADLLRTRLRFEVIVECDLDRKGINDTIQQFVRRLQPKGVALFYYSGHGVEVGGQNYLLPIGHDARTQSDVDIEGYPLQKVIEALDSAGSTLNVVLLDACRDSPLPAGSKGASRGLAQVNSEAGTIVGFATRAGATAADGQGMHSPYTQALLDVLPKPGLAVPDMLNEVGLRTMAATASRQQPWLSQSPVPRIFLAGTTGSQPGPPPPVPAGQASPESGVDVEALVGPMVDVPGGEFGMGIDPSPEMMNDEIRAHIPRHTVRIRSFRIGKHEVTRGQFAAFVSATGYVTEAERNVSADGCKAYDPSSKDRWSYRAGLSWRDPGFPQTDSHPVVCVSWNDVQAYIEWLNDATSKSFRLPSEAEWESALAADIRAEGMSGPPRDLDPKMRYNICLYANLADSTALPDGYVWPNAGKCSDGFAATAPVGSFRSFGLGLDDVVGNVLEWVEDCAHKDYYGAPDDGSAWTDANSEKDGVHYWVDCDIRVLRSSDWAHDTSNSSNYLMTYDHASFHRSFEHRSGRRATIGFRLAQDQPFRLQSLPQVSDGADRHACLAPIRGDLGEAR